MVCDVISQVPTLVRHGAACELNGMALPDMTDITPYLVRGINRTVVAGEVNGRNFRLTCHGIHLTGGKFHPVRANIHQSGYEIHLFASEIHQIWCGM